MKTIIKHISLLLCLVATLASCERKPLYDDCICHDRLTIPIDVDWSVSGVEPQNVSVLIYNTITNQLEYEHTYEHNDKDIQSYVSLPIGSYKAVIFNELRNEIDYVSCVKHEKFETLKFESNNGNPIRSRSSSTRGYVEQPGDLAVAIVEGIEVTTDMIIEAAYADPSNTRALSEATRVTVESLLGVVTLKKTNTIKITAHIKGINNARLALADLINLSDGYFVEQDKNSTIPSTQQFAMNNRVYDQGSNRHGTITATISSFGTLGDRFSVIDYDDSTPVILDILFKLVDEKQSECSLKADVTDRMTITKQDDGSVFINIDIDFEQALPDVIPAGSDGNSGFESSVEDWGDIIPLPLE